MFERSWEGEVEIRVPGKDSLRVTGRLWRHDDAGGTDWGGQLEIDVPTATRLGTGDYVMVLPDGRESTVRLSRGASRARSAYPTFAGRGDVPFGKDLPKHVLEAREDSDGDDEPAIDEVEAQGEIEGPVTATPTARSIRRRGRSAASSPVAEEEPVADVDHAVAEVEEPDEVDTSEDESAAGASTEEASAEVIERPKEQTPDIVQSAASVAQETPSPRPARPHPPEPSNQVPEVKMADSPRTVVAPAAAVTRNAPDGASRTEILARAYLQAIETRRELERSAAGGFEGLILGGIGGIVDELAALFERRLRGERPDRQHSADWLQQRFIVLDWFRAVVDGHEPMAALSADLQSLVDTAVALFGADEEQAAA